MLSRKQVTQLKYYLRDCHESRFSALPWRHEPEDGDGLRDADGHNVICNADGDEPAQFGRTVDCFLTIEAVNNFEALIETCERLYEQQEAAEK